MQIINNLDNINNLLADLIADDEYTSIGYIATTNSITASDIITIKKAQKLLDVVVVQNISNQNFDNFSKQSLHQLSVNLVIDYIKQNKTTNFNININAQDINSYNLFKGILSILPSSAFINKDNFEVFKAVTIINDNFKDLFSLHDISTPDSLMSFSQLEAIKLLQELDKSKAEINEKTVISTLSDLSITNYQSFNINNNIFVNLTYTEPQTKQDIAISYCFKRSN